MNRQLFIFNTFRQKNPVRLSHTIGILVIQLGGHIKFYFQLACFACAQISQENMICQSARLVGRCLINELGAVIDAHSQPGQKILHRGHGFIPLVIDIGLIFAVGIFSAFTVGQRITIFIMDNHFHVKLDIVTVCRGIFNLNDFRQMITGYYIFESIKQIRSSVLAASLKLEALRKALKCYRWFPREGRKRQAHDHQQNKQERGAFFCSIFQFQFPAPP